MMAGRGKKSMSRRQALRSLYTPNSARVGTIRGERLPFRGEAAIVQWTMGYHVEATTGIVHRQKVTR